MDDSESSSPSELPLDEPPATDEGLAADPPMVNDDLPDELPLSQVSGAQVAEVAPQHGELPAVEHSAGAAGTELGNGGHSVEDVHPPPAIERPLRLRRGRRDVALLAALEEAEALTRRMEADARPAEHPPEQPLAVFAEPGPDAASLKALVAATSVDLATHRSLLPRFTGGFSERSLLGPAAQAACRLSALQGDRADQEVLDFAKHFLSAETMPIASKRVVAEQLGVDERKVGRLKPRLAALVLLSAQEQQRALEAAIASSCAGARRLLYIEACAYDETPLSVQIRKDFWSLVQQGGAGVGDEGSTALTGAELAGFEKTPLLQITTNASEQKILQHQGTICMLLRVADRSVILKSPPLAGLVVMENGTAEVLASAELRLSTSTEASASFEQRVRAAHTDAGAPNFSCEKMLSNVRAPEFKLLHRLCDIHRTSLVHGKTFALLDDNVRGMIACALSLRVGSAMTRFRRCLKAEIESRLQILHGQPPRDATRYKLAVLRLFVSQGRNLAVRRLLLVMCPNGDWRSPAVQYYAPLGEQQAVDRKKVLAHLTTGLLTALCACRPEVYPRHRWTGCDLATDDLSIMEACHGLLSSTYKRLLREYQPSLGRTPMGEGPHAAKKESDDLLALEDDMLADAQDQGARCGGEGDPLAAMPAGDAPDMMGETAAKGPQVNAANRRGAAMWLESKPFGKLVLQRLLMEPLRHLLAEQFRVAGTDWEKQQQCDAASSLSSGSSSFGRQFRPSLAAQGLAERGCKDRVRLLLDKEELWDALPTSCFTVSFRSLSFRSISRLACSVHQLLECYHMRFPIRLFALLHDPSLAKELSEVPECMMDPWTASMKARFPTFDGEVFMHTLVAHSLVLWNDISVIESKHASVRRCLKSASLQTHTKNFPDLSADFCLLQARTMSRDFAPGFGARAQKAMTRKASTAARESRKKARVDTRCEHCLVSETAPKSMSGGHEPCIVCLRLLPVGLCSAQRVDVR